MDDSGNRDEALLAEAARWRPEIGLADLSRELLADLSHDRGIDFATAVAFDRVRSHRDHALCLERVKELQERPCALDLHGVGMGVIPNSLYTADAKSQAMIAAMRRAAEQLGCSFFQPAVSDLQTLDQNGRVINETLLERAEDHLVLISISKGSADLKTALAQPEAEAAFAKVAAWINVCGLLDGCPTVNHILNSDALRQQVLGWYRNRGPAHVDRLLDWARECASGPGHPLSASLQLPPQVRLLNVVPFPLQCDVKYAPTRFFHQLLAEQGPNDGFGLLADMLAKPGYIYPVWRADHYIDQFVDVEILTSALVCFMHEVIVASKMRPVEQVNDEGSMGVEDGSFFAQHETRANDEDHQRLRHAREVNTGFAVGRYLQTPPMLFTRDGHNVFLGDMYRGRAGFLLGGGPSLAIVNGELLQQRGIVSCGMNNAATVIRPQLWVSVDDPGSFADAIWRDPGIWKFVPLCHMEKQFTVRDESGELVASTEVVGDMPAVFGYRRNECFRPEQWLYEDTFNWGNQSHAIDASGNKGSRSVMYIALRLLFYLGIRRIFLLGCDFKMAYGAQNYAFPQERSRSSVRSNNDSYRIFNSRMEQLKPYFEREGLEVFNCNPDSGLTVFPYLSLDCALEEATQGFREKIDTSGMYDRLQRLRDAEKQAKKGVSVEPARTNGAPRSKIPEFTLVSAVDHAYLEKLRLAWPTWMRFRPELRRAPVILVHDESIDPDRDLAPMVGDHPNVRYVAWSMRHVDDQREKMLTGLIHVPAKEVRTPWYLKLDVDVVATKECPWVLPEWFETDERGREPVYVASPWGYTKPADAIRRLDDWGDVVADLRDRPRLNLAYDQGARCVSHPRIISWCFFGNTVWTRDVAAYAPARLPCASHDTYLFYCATRRGDHTVTARMSHLGWEHLSRGVRRFRRRCEEVMATR